MKNKFNKNITILIQIASWSLGLLIAAFLIIQIDTNVLKKAFLEARLTPFIILMGVFVFFWLFFESYNLHIIIRKYAAKVSYAHITLLRAVTYLLMLVNYNLGIGGILLGLSFKHGLSLKDSTAIVLLYTFIDFFSLSLLTLVSTAAIKKFISSPVLVGLFTASLCFLITLLAIYLFFTNINKIQHLIPVWLYKLTASLNHELSLITLSDLLKFTLYRILYFLSFTVFFYFAIPFFHFHIPFVALLALLPPIFFIGNLPITPAGIGTIQAAMLFFFNQYGDYSSILLFSISYTTLLLLYRLSIGFSGLLFFNKNKYPFESIDKHAPCL
jgi:uncharacterized membrane protein YbhN (UPF0104 family)